MDYPVRPIGRYGYGKPPHRELYRLLDGRRGNYRSVLEQCLELSPALSRIPLRGAETSGEPSWVNGFFSGLDSATLYTMLSTGNPEQYVEVGSGNSTKFARRAIRDGRLRTRITSIDPHPRASIDSIADKVVRKSLEEIDLSFVTSLRAGDIVFIDGSHRCFMNSDVTVAFLEILPRLSSGVRVHFHDIFLPYDYPPGWEDRYYSEQYVLASYLLGGANGARVLLANAFVSEDMELRRILDPIWASDGWGAVERIGCSFWLEVA